MRSLANRTQESTEEIQKMIGALQTATKDAVASMSSSRSQALLCANESEHMVKQLLEINASISNITDMTANIATSVEQQSAVALEINGSLFNIRNLTQKNIESTVISDACATFESMSTDMDELALQFWRKKQATS